MKSSDRAALSTVHCLKQILNQKPKLTKTGSRYSDTNAIELQRSLEQSLEQFDYETTFDQGMKRFSAFQKQQPKRPQTAFKANHNWKQEAAVALNNCKIAKIKQKLISSQKFKPKPTTHTINLQDSANPYETKLNTISESNLCKAIVDRALSQQQLKRLSKPTQSFQTTLQFSKFDFSNFKQQTQRLNKLYFNQSLNMATNKVTDHFVLRSSERPQKCYTNTKSFAVQNRHSAPRLHVQMIKIDTAPLLQIGPQHQNQLITGGDILIAKQLKRNLSYKHVKMQEVKEQPTFKPAKKLIGMNLQISREETYKQIDVARWLTQKSTVYYKNLKKQMFRQKQLQNQLSQQTLIDVVDPQTELKEIDNFNFDMINIRKNHQPIINAACSELLHKITHV